MRKRQDFNETGYSKQNKEHRGKQEVCKVNEINDENVKALYAKFIYSNVHINMSASHTASVERSLLIDADLVEKGTGL